MAHTTTTAYPKNRGKGKVLSVYGTQNTTNTTHGKVPVGGVYYGKCSKSSGNWEKEGKKVRMAREHIHGKCPFVPPQAW